MNEDKFPDAIYECLWMLQAIYGETAPNGGNTLHDYVFSVAADLIRTRPLQEQKEIAKAYLTQFYSYHFGTLPEVSLNSLPPRSQTVLINKTLKSILGG